MLKVIFSFTEMAGNWFEKILGKNSGVAYMIAQSFLFSIQNVFIKRIKHVPALEITFFRGFGMFIINHFIIIEKKLDVYPSESSLTKLLMVRGLLGFLHTAFILMAFELISLVDSITIYNLNPVFMGIAGAIFLKEPFHCSEIFAAIISFVGFLFIVRPPFLFNPSDAGDLPSSEANTLFNNQILGGGLTLASSMSMVAVTMLLRKVKDRINSFVSMQYLAVGIITFAPLFLFSKYKAFLNVTDFISLSFVVMFAYVAEICRTRGIQLEKAATGAILNYTQIIFSLIWDILILDEGVPLYSIIGIVFIFIGGYIVIKSKPA